MPYAFEYDPGGARCVFRYSGHVDADLLFEATAHATRLLTGPAPQCLVDGLQIRSLDLDPEGFARILDEGQVLVRLLGPGRSAFAVPERYHSFAQLFFVRLQRHGPPSGDELPPREHALFTRVPPAMTWLAEGPT